jgi:hypothetical protein
MADDNPYTQFVTPPTDSSQNPYAQFISQPPAANNVATPQPAATNWSSVPLQAVENLPASAGNLISNTVHPLLHPIQTAESFYDIGKGLVSKAAGAVGVSQDPTQKAKDEASANAVGQFFKNRYGSMDNLKNTLATDPAGVLADASTVLTLGGSAAERAPGIIGDIGEAANKAGQVTNPIASATKYVAAPVAKAATNYIAKPVITNALGLSTGAGPTAVKTATNAGLEGNQAFLQNMRGDADPTKVVAMARSALGQMREDRATAYNAGMGGIAGKSASDSAAYRAQMGARAEDAGIAPPKSADPSVLSFDPIDTALSKTNKVKNFQGVDLDPETAETREKVSGIISDWKNMDPETFHTPVGFDALKQRLGNLMRSLPYNSPERTVAQNAYSAVRSSIVQQAPEYAKVMKDYEKASDQIDEVEKTLSLKPNTSSDTTLRKLQSIMRNDVSSNYGARAKLGDVLAQYEPNLPKSLAGQMLNSALPRGLSRVLPGMEAGAAYFAGHLPALIPALAASSPRLVGETAYGLGAAGRGAGMVASKIPDKLVPGGLLAAQQAGQAATALYPYKRGGMI